MDDVENFLLENLDASGLNEVEEYKNKKGFCSPPKRSTQRGPREGSAPGPLGPTSCLCLVR